MPVSRLKQSSFTKTHNLLASNERYYMAYCVLAPIFIKMFTKKPSCAILHPFCFNNVTLQTDFQCDIKHPYSCISLHSDMRNIGFRFWFLHLQTQTIPYYIREFCRFGLFEV